MREWIDTLEKEGELVRVKAKVNWDLEIGGITQEVFDQEGPALLFENIKDHENTICTRLLTAALSTYPRIALAMGLPKDTPYPDLIRHHLERRQRPLKPKIVKDGPVKENIIKGEDVNLYQFPAPKWHKMDGGRYLGTFDGVVTKDPETGWINVGIYRRMIHDRDHLGITIIPGQDIWRHFRKYRRMGRPMPVAAVSGWDPVLPMMAACAIPPEVDEYEVIGALRLEPVELIRCETVDLYVPASAEIVFEGEVDTDFESFRMEGPFGEYTGYYTSEANKKPVFTAKCITHRDDPILQGTMEGVPINEDHRISSVNHSSILLEHLRKNMTGVKAVNVDPSTGWANVFVQIDNSYLGQVHQVAANIWSLGLSNMVGKNIMVVDEDINIFDLKSLMWAFAYRVDPTKDIIQFPGWISPCDPTVHPEERTGVAVYKGTRLLIDATKPIENKRTPLWFGEKFAPVCYTDEETLRLIHQRWPEYGIPPGKILLKR